MSMYASVLIFKLFKSSGENVSLLNWYLYGLFLKVTKTWLWEVF